LEGKEIFPEFRETARPGTRSDFFEYDEIKSSLDGTSAANYEESAPTYFHSLK